MNYQMPVVVSVSKALLAAAGMAAIVGVLNSKPAMGATVTYDFTVDVYTGAYLGKYNGSFSYNGSTPLVPCTTNITTVCATPEANNLTVQFNFLGTTYTEKDEYDVGYPRVFFPISGTAELNPSGGLSFLVVPPKASVGFLFVGHTFQVGVTEDAPYYSGTQVGTVSYTLRLPDPEPGPKPDPDPDPLPDPDDDGGAIAVPEPSEIAGSTLALGLLGIGWYRQRRKAAVSDRDKTQ